MDLERLIYFIGVCTLLMALVAVKNTYDIQWSLKNETVKVQCR